MSAPDDRSLTPEEDREAILCQALIAFGQGSGSVRVSRQAAFALRRRYRPRITGEVQEQWGREGVQALERLRVVGRLAAQKANEEGLTAIGVDQVEAAARQVEKASKTGWCNRHDD